MLVDEETRPSPTPERVSRQLYCGQRVLNVGITGIGGHLLNQEKRKK